jgi:hypothetical protein
MRGLDIVAKSTSIALSSSPMPNRLNLSLIFLPSWISLRRCCGGRNTAERVNCKTSVFRVTTKDANAIHLVRAVSDAVRLIALAIS